MYYTVEYLGEILTDSFGNTIRFGTYHDALVYIEECMQISDNNRSHYDIVRQY